MPKPRAVVDFLSGTIHVASDSGVYTDKLVNFETDSGHQIERIEGITSVRFEPENGLSAASGGLQCDLQNVALQKNLAWAIDAVRSLIVAKQYRTDQERERLKKALAVNWAASVVQTLAAEDEATALERRLAAIEDRLRALESK